MTNLPGPTGSAVATEDSRKGDGCKGSTDPACYDHTGNVGIGPVQVLPELLGIAKAMSFAHVPHVLLSLQST